MRQTKELGLTLPASGETNWGESYNNNFIKIDKTYQGFYAQMANLRNQMGALGLYYVDDRYKTNVKVEVQLTTNKDIQENPFYQVTGIKGAFLEQKDFNEELISGDLFQTLFPYTMFFIEQILDINQNSNLTYETDIYYIWTSTDNTTQYEKWNLNDYIVKYNFFNENGVINPRWKKMPQTVGGYYLPIKYEMVGDFPAVVYDKIPALEADSMGQINFPGLYLKPTEIKDNEIYFDLAGGSRQDHDASNIKEETLAESYVKLNYPSIIEESHYYPLVKNNGNYSIKTYEFSNEKWFIANIRFRNATTKQVVYCNYSTSNVVKENKQYLTIVTDCRYLNDNEVEAIVTFAKEQLQTAGE